ncbi:MAG: sugar ABC transporter ATP-binding protein [Subdoligranulum sp.]|nr:sugar ABC transporter ATP-binding protein [Subdoligranulum sp.]MBD5101707.1 sugar ABC transporter ATP-binding protein [Subdoligranulum sp.]
MEKARIETRNVSITFPGVKALSNVNFSVETGDIRAVVGANGAGKSTLMKVLAGANPGYTGEVLFNGSPVELRNPAAAKKLGIEIVYQEVDMALFPSQTVAENIMMNKLIGGMKGKAAVNWPGIRKEARETLQRLHIDIDVNKLVSELSLAQKQMVLIARAVQGNCNFLILDEPTAPLSTAETDKLFELVDHLTKTEEIAIIFISHRLQEVLQICKTLTVMRNGEMVDNSEITPETTINEIVTKMLGRSFSENFPKVQTEIGEVAFEVEKLCDKEGMLKDVSFNVRRGEIVGISGLVGAGKSELCKTIFGARDKKSGTVKLDGKALKINSPTDAVRCKLGLVPEERRKEGVLVDEPIYFNLSAANLAKFCNGLIVSRKKQLDNAEGYIKSLGIVTPSSSQRVALLSGGNQQKVAVGKWLAADCDVYIFDEPTKGVDIGAKHDIFTLIGDIAAAGKCAIYVTSETSEILAITDRTYVMYDGRVTAELETAKTTEDEIMFYSTGGQKQ